MKAHHVCSVADEAPSECVLFSTYLPGNVVSCETVFIYLN